MTIEQQLIAKNTNKHVKGVWEAGITVNVIEVAFKMSRKKDTEIIQK